MQPIFTTSDAWSGGSLELLVLIENSSNNIKHKICNTLWQFPLVDGPYASNQIEPELQSKRLPDAPNARFGVADLGDGRKCAFGISIIEDEDGVWFYAGMPMGSLEKIFPVGAYPFENSNPQSWQPTIHKWFISLATHLHKSISYQRGIIGWLTSCEVEEINNQIIPEERYSTYLVWDNDVLKIFDINTNKSPMEIN